jgi:hypothetical protein
MAEASAQAVAVCFAYQFCLAVDKFYRAFDAGRNAFAAAVAFIFVDFYDTSDSHFTPLS